MPKVHAPDPVMSDTGRYIEEDLYDEVLVTDDVKKIGCTVSPQFDVQKVVPGGWAESQGIEVGDKLGMINGMPARNYSREELKAAMIARPFRFRMVKSKQKEAAVTIQRFVRGNSDREAVQAQGESPDLMQSSGRKAANTTQEGEEDEYEESEEEEQPEKDPIVSTPTVSPRSDQPASISKTLQPASPSKSLQPASSSQPTASSGSLRPIKEDAANVENQVMEPEGSEEAGKVSVEQSPVGDLRAPALLRAPRSEPDLAPSESLIKAVFDHVDVDQDQRLSEREMLHFIRYLDYPGSASEWTKEFEALCEFHGWNSNAGVDLQGFATLLDDVDDNYYVEVDQLEGVLKELELHPALAALGARALLPNERVPPGHDDARLLPTTKLTGVPLHVSFKGLNCKLLIDHEELSSSFQDAIVAELNEIVELPEESIKISLGQQPMNADIMFCTRDLDEANAVIEDLNALGDDLPFVLSEAIRNVPRIRLVMTGSLEEIVVDNIVAGEPISLVTKSRVSMIDEAFEAAQASHPGTPLNLMREMIQSSRSRDVSPDSGREGAFVFSGSDIEDSSQPGSRGPSPSRRALTTAYAQAPGGRWPGRKRVECRTNLNQFKVLLLNRSQSLAAAWRTIIDRRWQGRITLSDFTQACMDMGYSKPLRVWRELDVDHAGTVTLTELDWEAAEALGKFYAVLNHLYGSCKAAAKKWNLTGPRRFHYDNFLQLLVPKGIVSKDDAEFLFCLLSSCPCSDGWMITRAAAVTLREIQWLSKIGPSLPRPAFERVSPGMLGNATITPSTATPGGMTPGTMGFASPGSLGFGSPGGFLGPGSPNTLAPGSPGTTFATPRSTSNWDASAYMSDESTRMGEDPESCDESNGENTVFAKLHTEAMEMHARKKKVREENIYDYARANPQLQRKVHPQLYDRLYHDHKDMAARKKHREEQAIKEINVHFNSFHAIEGKASSAQSRDRLWAPRRSYAVPTVGTSGNKKQAEVNSSEHAVKQYCEAMSIQELMKYATKRADQLGGKARFNGESARGWNAFGKTREQIMRFIMQNPLGAPGQEKRVMPEAVQALFESAQKRDEDLQMKVEQAEQRIRDKEKATWACDLHPKTPSKSCPRCKRWAAIQAGQKAELCVGREDIDRQAWQRLHEQGLDHHKNRYERRADAFRDLLEQSDKMGLLHDRDLENAKLVLVSTFGTDPRWNVLQGKQRDDLIEKAIENYTTRREEAAQRGVVYGQKTVTNPETFFRLYLDGATIAGTREDKVRKQMEDEEQLMLTTSVHANTEPDPGVFHRLHAGGPRPEKLRQTRARTAVTLSEGISEALTKHVSSQQKGKPQMLLFSFSDSPWPPPKHFESEFRYALGHIGAVDVHQFGVRLQQGNPDGGGIIAEVRGEQKALAMFHSLPLNVLQVSGAPVHEVWSQDAEEDPVGDFVDWICERFNSLEDAFRHFDIDRSGTISRPHFIQVCKQKGFSSDINFVWHALDNGTALLDFKDWMTLQPYVAHKASLTQRAHSLHALHYSGERMPRALVDFAIALATQFADIEAAFAHFDTGGYGKLSFTEFQAAARSVGWTHDCRSIFKELDVNGRRQIGLEEFRVLHDAMREEQALHNNYVGSSDYGYQSYDWEKTSHQKVSRKGEKALGKGRKGKGSTGGSRSITAMQLDEQDSETTRSPRPSRATAVQHLRVPQGQRQDAQPFREEEASDQQTVYGKGKGLARSDSGGKGKQVGSRPSSTSSRAGPPSEKGGGKAGKEAGDRRYTVNPGDKGKGARRTHGPGAPTLPKLSLTEADEVVVYRLSKDPFLNGEAVRLLRSSASQDLWECHVLTGKHTGTKQKVPAENLADLEAVQYEGTEFISRAAQKRLLNDQLKPREGPWVKEEASQATSKLLRQSTKRPDEMSPKALTQDVSSSTLSPNRATFTQGSPQRASIIQGTPQPGSISQGSPQRASIGQGSLQRASLSQGSPQQVPIAQGSPHRASISQGSPQQVSSAQVPQQRASLSQGSPQQTSLAQGSPQRASLVQSARLSTANLNVAKRLEPAATQRERSPSGLTSISEDQSYTLDLTRRVQGDTPPDVKEKMLEQQWQKKPSQARASLVSSLQAK